MRALRRRLTSRDERGMTLIEVTVTVALTAIVMAMATYIMVNVLQETTGESASVKGVQQAQVAERSFTQYLRSAVSLLNIQTNDITFTSYSGMASGVPQVQTIEAELCKTTSPNVDSLEVIYGLPQSPNPGWNGVHSCNLTTTTTSTLPTGSRLVESFDISPPSAGGDIFTYYQFTGTAFTAFASTISAADDPTAVSAIKVNITFLPPPGSVTRVYHTELGTTLNTTIFLRNSS
jgi:prepilin-type N-terminal cleavage/methylation domain-containing protein